VSEGFLFSDRALTRRRRAMTKQELDCRTADSLWTDYARTQDPRLREALIHQFERLAYSIANRYAKGPDKEDIFQVARLGLVKAVDRFDPSTNHRFSTFATPTILGEIRRYFRDHSRSMRVPRGLQELAAGVERYSRKVSQRLGRIPTAAEIAVDLDLDEKRVIEALGVERGSHPTSLDAALEANAGGDASGAFERRLGTEEPGLERVDRQVCIGQLLTHLSEPLRGVVQLRYFAELSQREVARQLGLSQIQVSRMEKRALEQLRAQCAFN
jgi:RNA polymerase sigma-B factor